LAAILFPVFAQAKAAAKDSAALSNVKQMATGHLLYSSDYDDAFCLMITTPFTIDGTGSSVSGPWQALIRPYTKNMQIAYHPKSPAPSSSDAQKWIKEWQFWGVVPRALALKNRDANNRVFFNDGVLVAGVQSFVDGPFGAGIDGVAGTAYNQTVTAPSLSQTNIENISDVIMMAEATSYDFNMGRNTNSGAGTLGVFCQSGNSYALTQSAYGVTTIIGTPTARKSASAGADGLSGCAYPKGMTTMAATDGSAKAVDYRGRIFERATTSAGIVVVKRMWTGGL